MVVSYRLTEAILPNIFVFFGREAGYLPDTLLDLESVEG
jgi:hypothetical protein